MSFNSRSRGGSDPCLGRLLGNVAAFQFTLPRGERLCRAALVLGGSRFQFTLPRGERQDKDLVALALDAVFQFTLPRGERPRLSPSACP